MQYRKWKNNSITSKTTYSREKASIQKWGGYFGPFPHKLSYKHYKKQNRSILSKFV
jgi:hypothetical protein